LIIDMILFNKLWNSVVVPQQSRVIPLCFE
jgi:hypothetical protein